ncbi:class B sortase [Clostridium sp. D53t1_180928_C8]|uniref:class B sortase n=1 Tax=Clostridium sp. D53t1_180928_C8 TaxID=2787101 RepID=UPI0018A89123|nr:class B sortase [Clostridium sp. D53t1_180928_C8]
MKIKFKNIISFILFIIIIICLTVILNKNYKYNKSIKTYQEIRAIINNLEYNDEVEIKDKKLEEINPEYKFWLNIPDTVIDYPVVQGTDNEFYLKNNFYKEDDVGGTIFIDYENNILKDKNLILYGHNMRNGSMFSDINKFKEREFFEEGKIIINKDNKNYYYEVFSVFVEQSENIILKNSFYNNDEFNDYINNLKEKSMYNKENKIKENSSIITLYTCSYEFDGARTIVSASLVDKED